ncbi:hypothetical protein LY78DRAFT_18581 [Colletotrichum sublineola]|nr:hypothetical protein LY78DRAFT_18581 [Colletotrichum sublineola]
MNSVSVSQVCQPNPNPPSHPIPSHPKAPFPANDSGARSPIERNSARLLRLSCGSCAARVVVILRDFTSHPPVLTFCSNGTHACHPPRRHDRRLLSSGTALPFGDRLSVGRRYDQTRSSSRPLLTNLPPIFPKSLVLRLSEPNRRAYIAICTYFSYDRLPTTS